MTLNGSAIAFTSAFEAASAIAGSSLYPPFASRRMTSLKLSRPDRAASATGRPPRATARYTTPHCASRRMGDK
jgi:hypothetical protein